MSIKQMQGVPAKLEYLNRKNKTKRNANCKYLVDGLCNNRFSKRYQKDCKSRLNCDFSTPSDIDTRKGNKLVYSKNINTYSRSSAIKKNYFTKLDHILVMYNEKSYRADMKYNLDRDILTVKINYDKKRKHISIHNIPLHRAIQNIDNKIKFTIYMEDIISSLRRGHMDKVADYILLNNNKDIVEEVYFNSGNEIEAKIKNLVIYIVYTIVDGVIKTNSYF